MSRVWCDGCYDMVHFGHANSLRQAKALGDYLVVGVHSDYEVRKHKRPPIFTMEERCRMISGIRWVDEVVPNAPYVTDLEVLDENHCEFCCHGDDVTVTIEGVDTYQHIKHAKRYKEVERTAGISTTGLMERILAKTQSDSDRTEEAAVRSPYTGCSTGLLLTMKKIMDFFQGAPPKPGSKIVYTAGAFDLFHVGHLEFLEKARALGDYLIVGLHSDGVVNSYMGRNYPIMGLHERLLSTLACKYVSDVVLDAPLIITQDLIDHLKVDVVVTDCIYPDIYIDPYKYPREVNILQVLVSDHHNDTATKNIVQRILENRLEFEVLNEAKELKELKLLDELAQ